MPRLLASAFLLTLLNAAVALAQPSFSRSDIETGLNSYQSLSAGDFNGDGIPDLLVASHSLSENFGIYVLFGHGDGTFDPPSHVISPSAGSSLGAADLNNDGALDLMVLTVDTMWVLPGAGDGTFGAPIESPPVRSGVRPLFVDVNGDGNLDVILPEQSGGVSISLGNGDGTFLAATVQPITGNGIATTVAAGDFNGDGHVDLVANNIGVAAPNFEGATVSVLLGHGDGTWAAAVDYAVAPIPQSLAVADFNGDGRLDLAVASYATPTLSVLFGSGDGTFLPAVDYPIVGLGTADTAAADFNGDGRADLATCAPADALSIFTNAGDGTFGPSLNLAAAASCTSMAVADFNRDGRPDVALNYFAGSGTISVFLNTTAPVDTAPPVVTVAATPSLLWPANGRTVAVVVSGTIVDTGSGVDPATLVFTVTDEYGLVVPSGSVVIDASGQFVFTVPLTAFRRGGDTDGRAYTITVRAADLAGNLGSASTVVLVSHDRGVAPPKVP
jgi:hypothetical protein